MKRHALLGFVAGLFAALALFAGSAAGQAAQNYYVGASFGQSKFKDACSGLPAGFSCDENGTAWKLFGGYQFNPNLAVEVAFTDLGKADATSPAGGASVKATTWEVDGVGSWPVMAALALYGKLGLYSATKEVTGLANSAKDTNASVTFGLGVRYDMTANLAARAEWQRYDKVGGNDTGEKTNIDMLSIGVLWKFK
jgi:OOP family OmpA-OmpF porin